MLQVPWSSLYPLSFLFLVLEPEPRSVLFFVEVLLLGPGRAAFGLLRGYWLAC